MNETEKLIIRAIRANAHTVGVVMDQWKTEIPPDLDIALIAKLQEANDALEEAVRIARGEVKP